MTTSTLSQNGQTTIPAKVREFLHVGPSDKLLYRIDEGKIILEAASSSTEALYGSFKSGVKAPTKEELRAARRASVASKLGK
jgi:AbrB family looped-hinge helix DNA binding protein